MKIVQGLEYNERRRAFVARKQTKGVREMRGKRGAQVFPMKYPHPCLPIGTASASQVRASRVLVQLVPSSVPRLPSPQGIVQRYRQKKIP